ncbi:pantetheine-phosphate adenylyltransferase [Candidatus Fermentibacteria bacterium]|nr:MAG: pantetheine-phosphate adenylyltransferase [Candidatus Fermentibacteria bacterium]
MQNEKVIYPGTFDPVTAGHLDIIRRAAGIFPEVTIAVVNRSSKSMAFDTETRIRLAEASVKEMGIQGEISICSFDGLLVDYMKENGYNLFIRGLRANSDFEFEFQMQLMNRRLAPDITGIYMMPSEHNMYLSSTVVKEVAMFGGCLDTLVAPSVKRELEDYYRRKK